LFFCADDFGEVQRQNGLIKWRKQRDQLAAMTAEGTEIAVRGEDLTGFDSHV
jgi:hypothetical protein